MIISGFWVLWAWPLVLAWDRRRKRRAARRRGEHPQSEHPQSLWTVHDVLVCDELGIELDRFDVDRDVDRAADRDTP